MSKSIVLVVLALVAAVSSQSYPHFELRESVLVNNSYVFRGNIREGHNESLHCVTDNSECCNNGQGHWYDERGTPVHNGSDGNSDLYVTRGDGVVYLNRRRGGRSGMWRCGIPDSNGDLQSIYIYTGTRTSGQLTSANIYFTLDSEANKELPEFTLTCQSRGGPVTEVVWTRNGVTVVEDSNHTTSQIIVDTSANTVYNNILRVRGREPGIYKCNVTNNIKDYINNAPAFYIGTIILLSTPNLTNLTATYLSPTSVSLEWAYRRFHEPATTIIQYIIYYQLGETSHNVSLTLSRIVRSHVLTGLSGGDISNVYMVAISRSTSVTFHLPSPVFGPADLMAESPVVMVSGEGSGVAGTSYNLTCRVSLPSWVGRATLRVQWVRVSPLQTVTISSGVYIHNVTVTSLPATDTVYTCTASYTANGVSSRLVEAQFAINVINIGEVSVALRGSGRREVGSVYTLICTVTLTNRVSGSSVTIHWLGPSTDQPLVDNTNNTMIIRQLSLDPLTLAHGGNYTCTAIYTAQERNLTSSYSKEVIPIEPVNPVIPEKVVFRDVKADSVLVQWTVSHISYSPETYVVQYGTSRDSLIYNSSLTYSKDVVTTYSVELSGLRANTTYCVQVLSTNTAQRSSRSNVESFTTSSLANPQPESEKPSKVSTPSVVGGIISLIIILIIGVSAITIVILIIKIQNLKSKPAKQEVAVGEEVDDVDMKSVPTDSNAAYGAVLHDPGSGGDVAMYEIVGQPPPPPPPPPSSSSTANPTGGGPSDYIQPSQAPPTSEINTYEVIATK